MKLIIVEECVKTEDAMNVPVIVTLIDLNHILLVQNDGIKCCCSCFIKLS